MTAGMFGYVVNDAFIKRAAEDLPLFQSIFLRGVVITALLLVIVRIRGSAAPMQSYVGGPILLRMLFEALGTVAYLVTLTKVPLAGLSAVMQLVPLAVTFAAARLLRERVNIHRIVSLLIGFAGVLCVIRPGGDDFTPWFLGGIVAVVMVVARELATRQVPAEISGTAIALGTAVVITSMGAVISVFEGWQTPSVLVLALLSTGAGFLCLGYVASVNSIRLGDLSFSAPFRYTVLVFAIALQIIVFGEVPDALTFVGSGLVAAAGFYALALGAQDA